MNIKWDDSTIIDLQNVINISRDNPDRIFNYLTQFKELIPERLDHLKVSLLNGDRRMIRQILHKMSPQLQFFGIKNITTPIQRMEFEYQTMPIKELEQLVNNIITTLDIAVNEVSKIINSNFE
jgi:HPt (histidine-containing phosphotransfer) domain-containing protein